MEVINQYYLRIDNDKFGFVVNGIHDIKETDVEITNDDYDTFFELQGEGKQLRLKQNFNPQLGLFGYVEEYIPSLDTTPQPPTQEERLLALENLMLEIL